MTRQQITSLHTADPFIPFRVHMASGKSIDVPHPDFLHLSPTGRLVTVYDKTGTVQLIDVLLVTSIETLAINGAKTRRRPRAR